MLDKNLPTVCLGGGGYTVENVSRCWAIESAIAVGVDLPDTLPSNLEYESLYTSNKLFYDPVKINKTIRDYNSKDYINKIFETIDKNLKEIEIAPGVPFMDRP